MRLSIERTPDVRGNVIGGRPSKPPAPPPMGDAGRCGDCATSTADALAGLAPPPDAALVGPECVGGRPADDTSALRLAERGLPAGVPSAPNPGRRPAAAVSMRAVACGPLGPPAPTPAPAVPPRDSGRPCATSAVPVRTESYVRYSTAAAAGGSARTSSSIASSACSSAASPAPSPATPAMLSASPPACTACTASSKSAASSASACSPCSRSTPPPQPEQPSVAEPSSIVSTSASPQPGAPPPPGPVAACR
eukprot:360578-Chlamydomonas_euryale.AAC.13